MGFLLLDNGDIEPTKQITISLWFRVPSATLTAVHAAHQVLQDAYDNDETGTVRKPPANSGIIPLVTFGQRNVEMHEWPFWDYPEGPLPWEHSVEIGFGQGYATYNWSCIDCEWQRPGDVGGAPLNQVRSDDPTFVGDYTDKSFIGINCRGGTPVFDFRLQFDWADGPPAIQGVLFQTDYEQTDPVILPSYYWFDTSPICGNEPHCGPDNLGTVDIGGTTYYWEGHQFDYLITQTFGERPYINWAQNPEFFGGFPDGSVDGGQAVSGDKWHHVVFSIDIDHEINTQGTQAGPNDQYNPAVFAGVANSSARCWLSFDDANKTGTKLSRCTRATGFGILGDGLNDLVTDQAWVTFKSYTETNYTTENTQAASGGGVRNDTYEGRTRPGYVWTSPNFGLNPITIPGDTDTVKLVEMAQLQVFTGVVVDTSDVAKRRLFVTAGGKPADMAAAQAELGLPVIKLKGSTNWIAGASTGSGGALEPTGTITEYSPGPSL